MRCASAKRACRCCQQSMSRLWFWLLFKMLTLHWNHMGTGGNHESASAEMACTTCRATDFLRWLEAFGASL
jgi:hypothetical protein